MWHNFLWRSATSEGANLIVSYPLTGKNVG